MAAKEYFHFQNQYFEFNDENNTMTIATSTERNKDIAITTLPELQFQAQLYQFRGNVLRTRAVEEEGITDPSLAGPLFMEATAEEFLAVKTEVIDYINASI
jgi:hypothetical protein